MRATAVAVFELYFRLLPHIRGNVGLVFTKGDLSDIRKVIDDNKVITSGFLCKQYRLYCISHIFAFLLTPLNLLLEAVLQNFIKCYNDVQICFY